MFAGVAIARAQATRTQTVKNIVLVHGGFVDGSGWEDVYKILTKKGYNVTVVQNPTISLEGDVAVTKRVIDAQNGPVILVGHSYGGGSSVKRAQIRMLLALCISPHSRSTTVSLSVP
jgi:pimeloyl-ACP methyl ester carboxylesterase